MTQFADAHCTEAITTITASTKLHAHYGFKTGYKYTDSVHKGVLLSRQRKLI